MQPRPARMFHAQLLSLISTLILHFSTNIVLESNNSPSADLDRHYGEHASLHISYVVAKLPAKSSKIISQK